MLRLESVGVPPSRRRTRRDLNPQVAFGIVLRRLRLALGDSQDAFAHRTGYHRNYIGQLERGEKSPSLKALFDFAAAVGLRPSDLLKQVEATVLKR